MAKKATSAANLAADEGVAIPRLSLAEVGFSGIRVINKQILEEANRVMRFPDMLKTVSEMSLDPTIATALNVYRMMLARVEWKVKAPVGASQQTIDRAKFVESCMADMESSWGQFIVEVCQYLPYGFSIIEKVYRRRLKKNGSKFNDGLVGIGKLAPRSQDTIRYWYFSQDGRDLAAVGQTLVNLENGYRYTNLESDSDGTLRIEREKFLLFSADTVKGNPQGRSILKAVYLPYKQLTLLKDQLMLGVAKDMQGIPKVGIPPKFLDTDASPADKAVLAGFKAMVDGLAAGTQRGIIMPIMYDEAKLPMFTLDLIESKGGKSFDIPSVIAALQNDILTALSVDIVKLGSDTNGSFSLASSKENLLAMQLEHRLKEIQDVLNKDLMMQLYKLNGWDTSEVPTFEYGNLTDVDGEEFSKIVQRAASVGLMLVDAPTVNKIREVLGIEPIDEDVPLDKANLTLGSSSAGQGMEPGTNGNGTAKIGGKGSAKDASAGNANNAA
jgi:hypothetical protein